MKHKTPVLLTMVIAGLLLQSQLMAADAPEYTAALEKAENALCDAAGKVQLWSTSEILLERAAEAAAAADFDQAVILANEARIHVELAVATAAREKKNWQKGVPK